MESKAELKEIYFEKQSLPGDFMCVFRVRAVWVHCFQCSILDTFGLNKFNRIPPLETVFGNLSPDSKAGHLKMSDFKGVDHIWGSKGSKINLLLVYDKILISFNPQQYMKDTCSFGSVS